MNVAVLLQRAWAQVGADTLAYPRLTDTHGRPTLRVHRILFTRIFDPATKYAIENSSTIDDPRVQTAVMTQVAAAAERLDRVVGWHRALRDAYYRLPTSDRFLPDPVERLLAPAWEHARGETPSDPDAAATAADGIIAALRDAAGPLTSISLARELGDDGVVAALAERVAEAFAAHARWDEPDPAAERRLRSAAARLASVVVPSSGVIDPAADAPWRELRDDPATRTLHTRRTFGLTDESEPRPPAVRADTWSERGFGQAFAALDASLQTRLQRILAGDKSGEDAKLPADLTARAALQRAAELVAEPLSLGGAGAHAVFQLAAVAYSGLGAQREHSGVELPHGAARYLAARFRRAQGVAAVLDWQYGGFASNAVDFVANPLAYAFGRLWIRLSRTDFDGRDPRTPADAWTHVRGAAVSTGEHVRELSKRIVSRHLPAHGLHDVLDTDLEPTAGAEDGAEGDALAEVESLIDEAAGRTSLRLVVRHALQAHGHAAVEDFMTAVAGRSATAVSEADLADRWERWARETAQARTDAAGEHSSFDAQLGALPTYAQARARVLARRTVNRVGAGIGIHPVEEPGIGLQAARGVEGS